MLAGMADPARRLSNEFGYIQSGAAAADRVYEVLDIQPAITDPPNPQPLPALAKAIVFEDVDFHYHPDKSVLHNIQLEVRAGETIAIVGPNGCGKTTLVQLLPRFYDPSKGRITFDGVDIRDVRLRDLRQPVRHGVARDAAVQRHRGEQHRPGNARSEPGGDRSGRPQGPRPRFYHREAPQRLRHDRRPDRQPALRRPAAADSLARAILRNPEVLILDEATSQIDVESEQLIHKVLEEFIRNRTTLLITHRASTIALADRVLVMDLGRVVDIGTPNELAERCDLYRRLCVNTYQESAA